MIFKQSTLNRLAALFFFLLAGVLVVGIEYARQSMEIERGAMHRLELLRQQGRILAKTSDYLTDEARKFVVTADMRHLNNYWEEVEQIQRREQVLEVLRQLEVPREEFLLLERAKQYSDRLVNTEARAMRLTLEADALPEARMPAAVAAHSLSPRDYGLDAAEKRRVAVEIMFDRHYDAYKQRIMGYIHEFQQVSTQRAGEEMEQARNVARHAHYLLFAMGALLLAGGLIIFAVLHFYMGRPLQAYLHGLRAHEGENKTLKRLHPAGTWESRHLAEAFNAQFEANQRQLQQNNQLMEQMRQVSADLEAGNWLKTGQAELNDKISGIQDLSQLSYKIINFLARYLEAQLGAFYLMERNEADRPCLRLTAAHAYEVRRHLGNRYGFGEGLAGQAAVEGRAIVLCELPEDYVRVRSALGEAAPAQIIALPFNHENELKGVLELGFLSPMSALQREFLDQAVPSIAVAIHSAQSRNEMQRLLDGLQRKAG